MQAPEAEKKDVCLHLELTLAEPLFRHIIQEGANMFDPITSVAINISATASRAEASMVCSKEKARRKTAQQPALALTRREVQLKDL